MGKTGKRVAIDSFRLHQRGLGGKISLGSSVTKAIVENAFASPFESSLAPKGEEKEVTRSL
ncbi:hypothetical protein MPNT_220041 [Candidatus Methylacidithermus pantelleriae]|uniref:Uncharacterized protein n=1 Tax=Candidatus Methylacidithermus pantelleriae TaxID=2744239 RepID=A0A8J2BKW6_9BACT|nr:hypothetical protein MPNT_220041 [Candidatus Methylacidithermus pantelleriae]